MSVHTDIRTVVHLIEMLRHRHTGPADTFGFGYSRSDTDTTDPAAVPDGVELHFFTGRTRAEARR